MTKMTHKTYTRLRALTVALAALLPAAGCGTEDLRGDVIVASQLTVGLTPDTGLGGWLYVYLSKDECGVDNAACGTYRLQIDGKYVVWAESFEYATMFSANAIGLIVAPGPHVFALVGEDGNTIATTETVEARADMFHHLAVFGPAGALVSRWLVDDPAVVPAGMVRARIVNALAGGAAIAPVQCTDPERVTCAALAGPLVHGGVFQGDFAPAALEQQELGWRVDGVAGAVFNGAFYRNSGPTSGASYSFHMPLRLNADPSCPTCIGSSF